MTAAVIVKATHTVWPIPTVLPGATPGLSIMRMPALRLAFFYAIWVGGTAIRCKIWVVFARGSGALRLWLGLNGKGIGIRVNGFGPSRPRSSQCRPERRTLTMAGALLVYAGWWIPRLVMALYLCTAPSKGCWFG